MGLQAFPAPVIHLAVPVGLDPVLEHPVQPALGETPLDVEHRTLGHPACWPALVGLEQDAGPVNYPGGILSRADRWRWLYETHPDLFDKAIALEENSKHFPSQRLTDQAFR